MASLRSRHCYLVSVMSRSLRGSSSHLRQYNLLHSNYSNFYYCSMTGNRRNQPQWWASQHFSARISAVVTFSLPSSQLTPVTTVTQPPPPLEPLPPPLPPEPPDDVPEPPPDPLEVPDPDVLLVPDDPVEPSDPPLPLPPPPLPPSLPPDPLPPLPLPLLPLPLPLPLEVLLVDPEDCEPEVPEDCGWFESDETSDAPDDSELPDDPDDADDADDVDEPDDADERDDADDVTLLWLDEVTEPELV